MSPFSSCSLNACLLPHKPFPTATWPKLFSATYLFMGLTLALSFLTLPPMAQAHCKSGEVYVPFVGWRCADVTRHYHNIHDSNGSLKFEIESDYPSIIHLEFYSQGRNAAWPGGDRVYVIDDYDLHTYDLRCQAYEKICYGAWVKGNTSRYWGVGKDDTQSCRNCCYTCDGGVAGPINLTN